MALARLVFNINPTFSYFCCGFPVSVKLAFCNVWFICGCFVEFRISNSYFKYYLLLIFPFVDENKKEEW